MLKYSINRLNIVPLIWYTEELMNSSTLPLLDHPLEADSAFTPEALIAAVRSERRLAAEPIPPVCVLDFDGDLTDWLISNRGAAPCPGWACFHTTLYAVTVDGQSCAVIPRTIGGPYAVLVAEQLAASGAKVVIGLTSAGRVSPDLPIPSLVVATRALRDEGTSYHYVPPQPIIGAPSEISDALAREAKAVGLPVSVGLVWTTDAPYRETLRQLRQHAQTGALAVEMQAASLFAFAVARGVPVGVLAHVTNAIGYAAEQFDKGESELGYEIFKAVCRAGRHALHELKRA